MEKKKLQRIIGILIVVALVIIVIPLVFTNKQTVSQPEEAAQLTVPTVPDQQATNPEIASSSNTVENANTPTEVNGANTDNTNNTTITKAPATALDTQLQAITSSATDVNTNNINNSNNSNTVSRQQSSQTETPDAQSSQATVRYMGDTVEVTPAPVSANNNASNAIDNNINNNINNNTVEITPAIAEDINRNSVTASNIASNNRGNPIASTLVKTNIKTNIKTKSHSVVKSNFVKKSAWVIQMGSFRNKSNAHRLVSQLKTVGFKAFIHEIKSSSGNVQTRVYVGPELKEASAKKLSTRVTKEMHMRGFIVPYKPMVF